ncbi:hypothetical protein JRO89_XS01G0129800 [Xanthoceras sorbifolium]|uniref:Centromere/kinetochore protein zw10-like protein n=1 Tax=Xanthoceras sorbifolium TaxID=99658 RepID=A0ABQ8IJ29_9ROSI|nr:hypothetical protein JRO89_XS01G0129800 [Xanthoceras sorbifolium]
MLCKLRGIPTSSSRTVSSTPLQQCKLLKMDQCLEERSSRINIFWQFYNSSKNESSSCIYLICKLDLHLSSILIDSILVFLDTIIFSPGKKVIHSILNLFCKVVQKLKVKATHDFNLSSWIASSFSTRKASGSGDDHPPIIEKEELAELDSVEVSAQFEVDDFIFYNISLKYQIQNFGACEADCLRFVEEGVARLLGGVDFFLKFNCSCLQGNDGVELRTVLEAMEVVGILDYGLAKVADLMIKHVITPAANHGSHVTFVEELNQGLGEMTDALLKMVPSVDPKSENVDGKIVYTRILQVIKFVYKCICLQNGPWVQSFGKLTWPRMSELIISNFLSKVVPEDASKLPDFQKTIQHTSKFETALKEIMFISASDNKDERLSNFAENVEVHFASRKKTEILAKARNLLLQSDFVVPQEYTREGVLLKNDVYSSEHVVDLLFLSERCVVSKAASQLMKLVHQTLKDVCLSSTRVALEFYHAARDVILLYEAVIPVKLERQLDGINQVAALMHNDCLYLSLEILALAFEYHADFPSAVKEQAVFVDMAPRFHLMAEEILQRQIQLVIFKLREAIDGADGFQNTHQMQQFESAKFSIDQVVFILEKVHIIWEPLLLPSTYKRSMCMVLESVFSRVTRDILLLDDMAAEETLQLQRLIHLMLENASSLLESLTAVNRKEKTEEYHARPLEDLIPSLRKIRKLAGMFSLYMPLKSITAAWESGDLVSCGFTLSEVEDLIKAIFTDSPLRKECLWRIENVSL